ARDELGARHVLDVFEHIDRELVVCVRDLGVPCRSHRVVAGGTPPAPSLTPESADLDEPVVRQRIEMTTDGGSRESHHLRQRRRGDGTLVEDCAQDTLAGPAVLCRNCFRCGHEHLPPVDSLVSATSLLPNCTDV